jgi:hypothetical protein
MDFAGANFSEILQNVGIIATLLLSAYTFWRSEQAQKTSNLIAITGLYRDIWDALDECPSLSRVLLKGVDVEREPPSAEEEAFVSTLIFHMDAAYEAMRVGMFVRLRGLKRDAREFFSLPVPKAVWKKVRPLQNKRLVRFVESALASEA